MVSSFWCRDQDSVTGEMNDQDSATSETNEQDSRTGEVNTHISKRVVISITQRVNWTTTPHELCTSDSWQTYLKYGAVRFACSPHPRGKRLTDLPEIWGSKNRLQPKPKREETEESAWSENSLQPELTRRKKKREDHFIAIIAATRRQHRKNSDRHLWKKKIETLVSIVLVVVTIVEPSWQVVYVWSTK